MSWSRIRLVAVVAAAACGVAAPAPAQLLEHKDLTAAVAITIAQTAIETCKAQGYAVSATVVGRNGEIIAQVRGDNSPPHTLENSFRKAYTARTLRSPSGALAERQGRARQGGGSVEVATGQRDRRIAAPEHARDLAHCGKQPTGKPLLAVPRDKHPTNGRNCYARRRGIG
jgi:uncharacterized protein GlcG (DUF336 family)